MNNLSIRERNYLMAGAVLLILFGIIQFVYLPATDKRAHLKQVLSAEKLSLVKMSGMQKQYLSMSGDMERYKAIIQYRDKGFTLFSFLDRQAERSRVKGNIEYMKPFSQPLEGTPYTLSKVKLKLKSIYLMEMINFLQTVETSKNGIQIISLSLSKSGKNKKLLNAVIETQALLLTEPG